MKLLRCLPVLVLAMLLATCSDSGGGEPLPANSLAALVQELGLPVQRDSLIACAASGQNGFLVESSGLPVSVIYLPLEGIEEHWYFETNGPVADKTDLSQYIRTKLDSSPLLNGFLEKFLHPGRAEERLGIVAAVKNGKLFISNEISIKESFQATTFSTEEININSTDPLMPAFNWPASEQGADAIYFHVVSDAANRLVSGTYTLERNFHFYNLGNVVLNIHDTNPPPALERGEAYTFSVMAVSLDNWVNSFRSLEFTID